MDQTNNNKSKGIQTLLGVIAGGVAIVLVQQFFFKAPTYDQVMMKAASELNKACPIMVDQETRLDNAVALPENIFQYNYTLINLEKAAVDVAELENYLRPTLINSVRTNPDMKVNRDNKTTMGYYYKDKNGEFLFKVLVTPDLYAD